MRAPAILLAAAAAATLAAAAGTARAETRDPRTLALGWMTENADAVVLGRAGATRLLDPEGRRRELDLLVDESVRGSAGAGTTLTVVYESAHGAPAWTAGAAHLCFLRSLAVPPGAPARWAPLSGEFSLKPVPADGPEARFPAVVRAHAALLGEDGAVARPDALRELLVAGMEEEDPGLAWSAATDFVRHEALHAGITAEQSARVVASFRRRPVAKMDKPALALAVACTRDPGAAKALVGALEDPAARRVRVDLALALRRLGDPAASGLLRARLAEAPPAGRADALRVLGILGAVDAAPEVRGRLADGDAAVRTEAAQALGLLARAAREADPAARLEGRADLEKVASAEAAGRDEARAALWALAQLDDPEAWAALRRLAAEDPREEVRRAAGRYLRSPRQSLILE
jgi:HEAT repeat protein